MIITSDWQYRIPEHGDDEFSPIRFWSCGSRAFYDHEDAAKGVARNLTSDDADYYSIFEHDGMEVEIKSPDGTIKRMSMGGYPDFVYTAEEVSNGKV